MVRWHHRLNGHELEQTLGDSEGQGSLVCCSPWDHKELDMTEQLNNNNHISGGGDSATRTDESNLGQHGKEQGWSGKPWWPLWLMLCE